LVKRSNLARSTLTASGTPPVRYRQASSQRESPKKYKRWRKDGKNMGYIQDLEKELRDRLPDMNDEELIKFFKEKVLESYRNGGAQSGQPAKGKGTASRRQANGYGER
jgi:hypothetical protein